MNKLEGAIQYLIYRHHNFKRVFPNIHTELWGGSEVDALYLTSTNRVYFYEIKISKSDFKNDFKKKRHKQLLERDDSITIKPKHFYYVCHGFHITPEEVPEYAGLIICDKSGLNTYPQPAKKAPLLWREPLSPKETDFLQRKITQRYLRLYYESKLEEWYEYRKVLKEKVNV